MIVHMKAKIARLMNYFIKLGGILNGRERKDEYRFWWAWT